VIELIPEHTFPVNKPQFTSLQGPL
jgi:hypothetical protein